MEVEITKLSQDLNLATGETENFAILELPNGSVVRARINEEAAQAITDCLVNGVDARRRVDQEGALNVQPPPGFRETQINGQAHLEFGGDSPEPPPPAPKTRLVGADEFGNPIVRAVGYAPPQTDPGELVGDGGYEADEDGVGQV